MSRIANRCAPARDFLQHDKVIELPVQYYRRRQPLQGAEFDAQRLCCQAEGSSHRNHLCQRGSAQRWLANLSGGDKVDVVPEVVRDHQDARQSTLGMLALVDRPKLALHRQALMSNNDSLLSLAIDSSIAPATSPLKRRSVVS